MNCQGFEAVAVDLARDQLVDASRREEALAHSAACARCDLRFANEKALTAGLRSVAGTDKEEAPARVEAALLSAFRQQQAGLATVTPVRSFPKRWYYAAASVAAIALIVALLALVVTRSRETQPQPPQKARSESAAVPEQSSSGSQVSPDSDKTVVMFETLGDRRKQGKQSIRRNRSKPSLDDLNTASAEIATDFIPLMNRETLAEMDGGQVMRVELPRSALISFGLPMDMERATERIKADVVVGNDGLARAIRFVR